MNSAASAPYPLAPVAAGERIEILDVVRGLALFGILAANMRGFNSPMSAYFDHSLMWTAPLNRVAQGLIDFFVMGKFITIFSFLFGIGFAIQMTRARERGVKGKAAYVRRLLILVALGLAHGYLLWSGDILMAYGVMGLLLLFFRERKQKTLLIWAAFLYCWPLLLNLAGVIATAAGVHIPMPPKVTAAELARQIQVYSQGSYLQMLQERVKEMQFMLGGFVFFYPRVLGVFLLGLCFWRTGAVLRLGGHLAEVRRWAVRAFAAGFVLNAAATAVAFVWHPPVMGFSIAGLARDTLASFGIPAFSAAYMAGMVLLYHSVKWRERMRLFAAVGKTALTNYLAQTVLCTTLFYSYGFGLFGRISPEMGLLWTFAIYSVLLAGSVWWTRRFAFGPLEYLWKLGTYGHAPGLRLRDRPAQIRSVGSGVTG